MTIDQKPPRDIRARAAEPSRAYLHAGAAAQKRVYSVPVTHLVETPPTAVAGPGRFGTGERTPRIVLQKITSFAYFPLIEPLAKMSNLRACPETASRNLSTKCHTTKVFARGNFMFSPQAPFRHTR